MIFQQVCYFNTKYLFVVCCRPCLLWHSVIHGLFPHLLQEGEAQVAAVTQNPKTKSWYKGAVRVDTDMQITRDRQTGWVV